MKLLYYIGFFSPFFALLGLTAAAGLYTRSWRVFSISTTVLALPLVGFYILGTHAQNYYVSKEASGEVPVVWSPGKLRDDVSLPR